VRAIGFLMLVAALVAPLAAMPTSPVAAAGPAVNRDGIAVIIGNRHYAHGLPEARYAAADAAAVRRFALDVLGFRDGNVIELIDASQAEMYAVFGNAQDHRGKLWSWVRAGRSDVLVFYSGHGVPGLRDRRGYLLPVDADPATPEINGYPLDLLLRNLEALQPRSATVLIDACFSGDTAAGWLIRSASPVYVRTAPPAPSPGLVLITAAEGDQVASWDHEAGHGLFTRHLLDALHGAADRGRDGNGDGMVSLGEVERYLDEELTYAARRLFRRVQRATVAGDPATVLVAALPASPPPPLPAAPPATASRTSHWPVGTALYDPPSGDPERAAALLAQHGAEVEAAVRAYYREQGPVWDFKSVAASIDHAEHIAQVHAVLVDAVDTESVDLRVQYRWEGNGATGHSEAKFRLRVAPDALSVTKMWR